MQKIATTLLSVGLAFAQVEPLTDARISELAQKGVRSDEMIRLIRTAPSVNFDLAPAAEDQLMKAGVSEDVIKAMAAREMGQVAPVPAAAPVLATAPAHRVGTWHRKRTWILVGVAAGGLSYLGYRLSNPTAAAPSGCIGFCGGNPFP